MSIFCVTSHCWDILVFGTNVVYKATPLKAQKVMKGIIWSFFELMFCQIAISIRILSTMTSVLSFKCEGKAFYFVQSKPTANQTIHMNYYLLLLLIHQHIILLQTGSDAWSWSHKGCSSSFKLPQRKRTFSWLKKPQHTLQIFFSGADFCWFAYRAVEHIVPIYIYFPICFNWLFEN